MLSARWELLLITGLGSISLIPKIKIILFRDTNLLKIMPRYQE